MQLSVILYIILYITLLQVPVLAFGCGCNNTNNYCGNVKPEKKVEAQKLYCEGVSFNIPSNEQKIKSQNNQALPQTCCGNCLDTSIKK